jgi:hypothetical protein
MQKYNSIFQIGFFRADCWLISFLALLLAVYFSAHNGTVGNAITGLANLGDATLFQAIGLWIVVWAATLVNAGGIAGYAGFKITLAIFAITYSLLAIIHRNRYYGFIAIPVSLATALILIAGTFIYAVVSARDMSAGFFGEQPTFSGGDIAEGLGFLIKLVLLLLLALVLAGFISFVIGGIASYFLGENTSVSFPTFQLAGGMPQAAPVGRYYHGTGYCPICGSFHPRSMPKICTACKHDLVMVGVERECSQCGESIYEGERFCRYCGANQTFRKGSSLSERPEEATAIDVLKVTPTGLSTHVPQDRISPIEKSGIPQNPQMEASSVQAAQGVSQVGATTNTEHRLFCRSCGAVYAYTQQGQLCVQCNTVVSLPLLSERSFQCGCCRAWHAPADNCCWQCGAPLAKHT